MSDFSGIRAITTGSVQQPSQSAAASPPKPTAPAPALNPPVETPDASTGSADQWANPSVQRAGSATAELRLMDGVDGVKPSALKPATPEQIRAAVNATLEDSYRQVPVKAGESRHRLNRRLQTADVASGASPPNPSSALTRYNGADVVIIAFEGTGAFDARRAPVMQQVAERLKEQGLSLEGSDGQLYREVSKGIADREHRDINWSGLGTGPLDTLLSDPETQANTQWLSFPSEELEVLAGGEILKNLDPDQLLRESVGSTIGVTPGIQNALRAMAEIKAQAKAQGKSPQFVVVSHSSGGRSTVKFLEKAKSQQFPLVMTLDPVREAHEAVGEALKETYLYKGTEHNMNRLRSAANWFLPESMELEKKKVYPPMVRSHAQPESLYKPGNAQKMINFYQKKDEEGLKMPQVRFGIQGSPVARAENIEIHDVGTAGHGEITYHDKVLNRFMRELKTVINP